MAGSLDREPNGGGAAVLELKNRLGDLDELHLFFERLACGAAWPERLGMQLTLACEELVTNTISYGYPGGGEHAIRLSVTLLERAVEVVLEDDAVPFNPLEAKEPDLGLSLEERGIGGLGVHFVRRLMDEIAYERTPGGNRLKMIKKL